MLRKAFVMEVKPGMIKEYTKKHNPIWPELATIIKNHGVHNYSIFHHPGSNMMFAYLEIEDEELFADIVHNEWARRWWLEMKQYLVSAHPADLKAKEEPLCEVFHLD